MALTKANGLAIVRPKIETATGNALSASDVVLLGALLDGVATWIEADAQVTATGSNSAGPVASVGTVT